MPMMGPGAAARVETCLDIIKEVKGWDLAKGSKAFLDAAKKAAEADKLAAVRIVEAAKAEAAADKKAQSVQRREATLKGNQSAFKIEKQEWADAIAASEDAIEQGRTSLANAVAAVRERETRATELMASADAKVAQAADMMRRAEKKEEDLKPTLDLIERLKAG